MYYNLVTKFKCVLNGSESSKYMFAYYRLLRVFIHSKGDNAYYLFSIVTIISCKSYCALQEQQQTKKQKTNKPNQKLNCLL